MDYSAGRFSQKPAASTPSEIDRHPNCQSNQGNPAGPAVLYQFQEPAYRDRVASGGRPQGNPLSTKSAGQLGESERLATAGHLGAHFARSASRAFLTCESHTPQISAISVEMWQLAVNQKCRGTRSGSYLPPQTELELTPVWLTASHCLQMESCVRRPGYDIQERSPPLKVGAKVAVGRGFAGRQLSFLLAARGSVNIRVLI